jgi:glycine/D-amino acid oxidase-like deaminating enzyme
LFSEGFYGSENPLFSWLPWNPAKGEILTIKILSEISWGEEIVNAGIFIVPIGNQTYRVGATYAWHEFSFLPTEKARIDLIAKLDKLLKVSYQIIGQEAGVRPATKLRRPFVGLHPEQKRFAIFNGLGSKGVSLAPYFAQQLVDFLENNQEINPEANIEQYYPLYFK